MSQLAQSARRSLHWQRPKGRAWPQLIEVAIERVTEAFASRKGALYREITGEMPRFVGGQSVPRKRAFRSDAAPNLCALLVTLLTSSSLQTGFVARPVGGHWERKTWGDLDGYAYGKLIPGERSFRRTERHARELIALGFVTVRQLRRKTADGYESLVAVKHLGLKLWRLLGMEKAVLAAGQRIKAEAAQTRAKARGLTVIAGIQSVLKQPKKPTAAVPSPAVAASPPGKPPPGTSATAREHLAAIASTLGIRASGK